MRSHDLQRVCSSLGWGVGSGTQKFFIRPSIFSNQLLQLTQFLPPFSTIARASYLYLLIKQFLSLCFFNNLFREIGVSMLHSLVSQMDASPAEIGGSAAFQFQLFPIIPNNKQLTRIPFTCCFSFHILFRWTLDSFYLIYQCRCSGELRPGQAQLVVCRGRSQAEHRVSVGDATLCPCLLKVMPKGN